MKRTMEWLVNEVRFVTDKDASTPERRVARADSEPRLTFVRENNNGWYYVDGIKLADQSSQGVLDALNAGG